MALRLRRGTDAERLLVTPLQGELVYATDTKKLYIGDGATVGGVLVGPADADQFTELVADTSPQLGGDLDLNGNNITGNGNIDINGTITATGNIGLGDDTADIINVGGVINSPLRPAIDGNYNLGSAIRRWNRLYAEGAVLSGQLDAEAIATGRILSNSSTVVYDEITDTLAAANINGTTVDATTVNATTINAGEVVANFRGSIFSDDSTPVFDGVNKTINVKGGTLDGVTIGADGVIPASNITGREVTATNGFIGNLTGEVFGDTAGTHTGSVLGSDSTIYVDTENGVLSNGTMSFNGSEIQISDFVLIGTDNSPTDHGFVFTTAVGKPIESKVITNSSFGPLPKITFTGIGGSYGSPTTPSLGDFIGGFSFLTLDSSDKSEIPASLILGQIDSNGTVSDSQATGKIHFLNNAGTDTALDLKYMTFDSSGRLAVNQEDANADCNLDVNGIARLAPQSAAPGTLVEGMIAVADGTTWDPAGKSGVVSYPVYYDGAAWQAFY